MPRRSALQLVYHTYFKPQDGWQYRAICPALGKEWISLSIRPDEARKIARKWARQYQTTAILQRRRVKITKRRKKHGHGYYGDASYILGPEEEEWEDYRIYDPEHPNGRWATPNTPNTPNTPTRKVRHREKNTRPIRWKPLETPVHTGGGQTESMRCYPCYGKKH